MQVEHGTAASVSATNGGSTESSGPHPHTITKVFIAQQYFEGESEDGQEPNFTVATRCPGANLGEAVVQMLKAIASGAQATAVGDSYSFTLEQPPASGFSPSGTATVKGGFVDSLSFSGTSTGTIRIGSVNSAPPVTAPSSATPTNLTCG